MKMKRQKKLSRIDKIEKIIQRLSERIERFSKENEKGFRELRETIAKLSERVDRAYELSEKAFAAADRAFAAADRASQEVAKASEEIRKLKTEVSRLTGSWGEFVEGMIEPSAIKFMEEKGFKVVGIYPEAKVSRDGENAEYDLYLVCEKSNNNKNKGNNNRKKEKVILLVSAKTKVSSRDVDELLEDMRKFFFFLEQYKGFKLIGAIAGIRFGKGADLYALRSGLIIMRPSGEVMEIHEPKKLKVIV
jgi:DNA repair exonuclease SbcCD ATPase subunit